MRLAPFALFLLAAPLAAQSAPQDSVSPWLNIPYIMRGDENTGRTPTSIRWTPDAKWIYFRWNEPGTPWRERPHLYRVRPEAGAVPERVSDVAADSVAPLLAEGSLSPDKRSRAVAARGDLFVVDLKSSAIRRLTDTRSAEEDPQYSVDGREVLYTREDNLFSIDLGTGLVTQLTDIRKGTPPKEEKPDTGQRGFLERDQKALFQSVRDRLYADSVRKAAEKGRDSLRAAPIYLAGEESVGSIAASPSGRTALLFTRIPAKGQKPTIVPDWVTTSGYVSDISGRENVGDAQESGRVGLVDLVTGKVRWLSLVPGDSTALPVYANSLGWNDAGTSALLFAVTRDFKRRIIWRVDAGEGRGPGVPARSAETAGPRLQALDSLRDSAWVDGPCFGCGGWVDGGKRAWFVSEADGWAHLYSVAADGSDKRQLTSGKWEVRAAEVTPDGKSFLLHTSEGSPYEQHLWRMPVNGGAREEVTTRMGWHDARLSEDGKMVADVFSLANRPPELFAGSSRAGAIPAQLTTSPTAEWQKGPWIDPAIITIKASDGVDVPAHIYRPQELGAKPNGAAVIFVHGAGYLQNVQRAWSYYSREYQFHHLLAAKGYVVLDMDYRGSAGYGRDWRTAIYRHMGGRDLQDEVDGSRYLTAQFGIAPERIGIYGGSYGGFMTLMALFTEGQYFGAGAALRSVTDWAHYNHGYTAQILNTPQGDSIAYRQSSPIYFAAGLNRPLLMAHGMIDTNVEFQDIVRLTERLIELHKTGWELAPYPVEDHGFVRPDSWTDEYRRILGLFEGHLPVR
ncbi:MAG: prolyl oligopeptidase family serine peptidase [Gemmatimonadales bacterium]